MKSKEEIINNMKREILGMGDEVRSAFLIVVKNDGNLVMSNTYANISDLTIIKGVVDMVATEGVRNIFATKPVAAPKAP